METQPNPIAVIFSPISEVGHYMAVFIDTKCNKSNLSMHSGVNSSLLHVLYIVAMVALHVFVAHKCH